MKKLFKSIYFSLVLLFIYLPIFIIIVFSFNKGETTQTWTGFTFDCYKLLFNNTPLLTSTINSILVAIISTFISIVIGVMTVIGLSKNKLISQKKWIRIANIPLVNADIITAISLMIMFITLRFQFGIVTLIMSHVSFNVPFVLITLLPRFRKIDKSLIEAGYDLGAKNSQVIFKLILPSLKSAIITATAIAFAMSFDDFIISYFTGGAQNTAPVFIYTAKKIKPYIFAFGVLIIMLISLFLIIWNIIIFIKQHKSDVKQKLIENKYKRKELSKLINKLNVKREMYENQIYIKKNRSFKLWLQLKLINLKIMFYKLKKFDKKITKLEWRLYKIKSKINKEKRLVPTFKRNKRKLLQLTNQYEKLMSNNKSDVVKIAKIKIKIEKLEDNIEFLEDQMNDIANDKKQAKKKILSIKRKIKNLKQEFKTIDKKDKSEVKWYKDKIKYYEEWIIELEEGKDHYKLRMIVEKIKQLDNINKNIINNLLIQKEEILNQIYLKINWNNQYQNNLFENKYKNEISKLESKISNLNNKINDKYNKLFLDDNSISNKKTLYTKSKLKKYWKIVLSFILFLPILPLLIILYMNNSTYDLTIANWGAYTPLDPHLITEFEKEVYDKTNKKIKINFQEYDSNETLHNKLETFNYDLMVPSDYMIQKLALENKIQKINWDKLDFKKTDINSNLEQVMKQSKINDSDTIFDYSIPYLWGDLVIVVNPTKSNIEFLNSNNIEFLPINEEQKDVKISDTNSPEIKSSTLSWEILWKAAKEGKNIALNNDPKNIFFLASQILNGKVNLSEKNEIDQASEELKKLISNKNVSLNNDELIDKVINGNFDFAVMYNGDAATASYWYEQSNKNNYFIYGRPNKINNDKKIQEVTNIFSDNIVISSNLKSEKLNLAYDFINFVQKKSYIISEYTGITSPWNKAMKSLIQKQDDNSDDTYKTYYNFKNLYIPIVCQNDFRKPENLNDFSYDKNTQLSFNFQNKKIEEINQTADEYIVNKYNEVISVMSESIKTQLVVLLIIFGIILSSIFIYYLYKKIKYLRLK